MSRSSLIVIGGGIVGLATAYQFTRRLPGRKVTVLEKEASLAAHQTGRNSGVLHSGIYYQPGSQKAKQCLAGKKALESFCQAEDIPYETCGKVIVAIDESQLPALQEIEKRGKANGVTCERIGKERLYELEPYAAGHEALHVPSTGIVNYTLVTQRLAQRVQEAGGQIILESQATAVRTGASEVTVESRTGPHHADQVVNCAGLYSDRVARLSGAEPTAQIVPFRGEYFKLTDQAKHLVKNLIYPVPDPRFPFLGVHFTRMIDGAVECGPNAVLAMAREGYHKTTINWADLAGSLTYGGFLRLASRHWRMGAGEAWRSISKSAFVKALQRLVPEIQASDLTPAPAGIRAQAVLPSGELADDFIVDTGPRVVNVLNAPSPAATASLQIGAAIVDQLAPRFA